MSDCLVTTFVSLIEMFCESLQILLVSTLFFMPGYLLLKFALLDGASK